MSDFFLHPEGICETDRVGAGTRIWAFAHVLPGAAIGADCNICDGVFIEGDVTVGDRVTIKSGVQLWDGVRIGDDVFLGPNATFTNDRFPRSRQHPDEYARTVVHDGASIGANATLLPGLEIGTGAMVGAGAVVTSSVPPHAIVVGNPAHIVGYVDSGNLVEAGDRSAPRTEPGPLPARGAELRAFDGFSDLRGSLAVGEIPGAMPFEPRRWFVVYAVPGREVRGEHAHHRCHQMLVCVHGRVRVALDDGVNRAEVVLDSPTVGLYVPPMVWASQFDYRPDTVLLVLASDPYDPDDYIRDYGEFVSAVAADDGH